MGLELVTGQAGTGKSTWLLSRVKSMVEARPLTEHQRILALTKMHGARRRIDSYLQSRLPKVGRNVTTIDGFALSLVNRWRTSLGINRPVRAVATPSDGSDPVLGIAIPFDEIFEHAIKLLSSEMIRRIVATSFPIIIVDEFQDCQGKTLDFIKSIPTSTSVLVAADDFQLLDPNVEGCPAVEWVQSQINAGLANEERLSISHRTRIPAILGAAKCMRGGSQSTSPTIPVVACQNHGPAGYKILEGLVYRKWKGTSAIIVPSNDRFVLKILESLSNQLSRKNLSDIRWKIEGALDETASVTERESQEGRDSATRFAILRGIPEVTPELTQYFVDRHAYHAKAFGGRSDSRVVTTVHGAKNREFDNVFIFWGYKLHADVDFQRRLLYNAITRARQNCVVLVLGGLDRANSDPVLRLLGPAVEAFPKNRSTRQNIKRSAGGTSAKKSGKISD